MPVTMKELGLDKLAAEDRKALGEELLDSVDQEEGDFPLTAEQDAIIADRVARIDAELAQGIYRGVPWEVVRDEARRKRHQ